MNLSFCRVVLFQFIFAVGQFFLSYARKNMGFDSGIVPCKLVVSIFF